MSKPIQILLMGAALVMLSAWPPYTGKGQSLAQNDLDYAKVILKMAEDNNNKKNVLSNKIEQYESSRKSKNVKYISPKTVIKYIKVPVTIVKKKTVVKKVYKDSIFVSNGMGVERPIVIYKAAPVYKPKGFDSSITTDKGLWYKLFRKKRKK